MTRDGRVASLRQKSKIAVQFSPSARRHLRVASLARPGAAVLAALGPGLEHLIDEAEGLGFVGLEELVAVHRLLDLLELLAGIFGVKLIEALAHVQYLACLDLDVRGHALGAARGLVNHDPAVGESDAHPGLASGKKEAAHRSGLADAHGADLGADV